METAYTAGFNPSLVGCNPAHKGDCGAFRSIGIPLVRLERIAASWEAYEHIGILPPIYLLASGLLGIPNWEASKNSGIRQ